MRRPAVAPSGPPVQDGQDCLAEPSEGATGLAQVGKYWEPHLPLPPPGHSPAQLEPQWAPPAEAVEAEFHPPGLEFCLLLFLTSWSLSPLTRIRGGAQTCEGHPSAQGSSSSFPASPRSSKGSYLMSPAPISLPRERLFWLVRSPCRRAHGDPEERAELRPALPLVWLGAPGPGPRVASASGPQLGAFPACPPQPSPAGSGRLLNKGVGGQWPLNWAGALEHGQATSCPR